MLAELDQAKTTFLTNVSHEFRTPLTLLLGPLDDAIRDTDELLQRDRLDLARRNAGRLLRLVNSLMEFSRIEAGRAVVSPVTVDLGALTAQIASSFAGLCERAGIDLVLACEPVVADVDVAMWETIVLNLMSNAVKYTFSGSITVTVAAGADQHCHVQVSDTGTGIPAAEMDRLFERFYRASNTGGRSVEGTGIGLSLVRSLVELNGGNVGIESQVDVGTAVTITLPSGAPGSAAGVPLDELSVAGRSADNAYVAEAAQWMGEQAPPALTPAAQPGHSRPLILIADDNPDLRAHLERILSERWDTISFPDGRAAFNGVHQHHPDVVVTDVMMPVLDGFGLVTELRSDPELASTPVIMLSARAGVDAAGDGFARGIDDYLTKPFSSQDLLNRVEARLSAAARQQAGRAQDETRARHDAALADVTAALASADSIQSTLAALLATPARSLGAVAVAMGLVDDSTRQVVVHYGGKLDRGPGDADTERDPPAPIVDVTRTGRPVIIEDRLTPGSRDDALARVGSPIQAAAIFPLRDSNAIVIGAVGLLWPSPRSFGPDEIELIADIADVAGTAAARVRAAEREHRIAVDFQDQLLDLDHGSSAVVVSALYQPASEAMRVGGDWYLVTPLDDDGRVAVCVGDVVGHGLQAAIVMGRLRAATAVTALTASDPLSVVSTVDRYASTLPDAMCSTLAFAEIDTTRETLSYVCAGHPYPLLIAPDGAVRYLEDGRVPPLSTGAAPEDSRPGQTRLPTGSLLIMYTDGLIERHDESLTEGFDRLATAASTCADLPVDLVCSTLVEQLAAPAGHNDDVVVVAMRPSGTTDTSFIASVPADLAQLAPVRRRLRDWLGGLGIGARLEDNIVLAIGETLANAIEHGNRLDADTSVSIEIFVRASTIDATICDAGHWTEDATAATPHQERGRGLTLVDGLADRMDARRTPRGTYVHLEFVR